MDVSRLPKREQVFVSSTYEDLREERQVVTQRLLELKCIPAGMELFPAASDDKWDIIRRVIEESDYYLLIVGGRYGSIIPGDVISFTEREFDYARQLGKPVLAFVRNSAELLADRAEHDPALRDRLHTFRETVKESFSVNFWSSPHQLGGQVSAAIMEARVQHPAEGWIKASEIRAQLGLPSELVEALSVAGIVEISPGLGGAKDKLLFDRLRTAKSIDIFANTAFHFLSLNETSLIEALRDPECRIRFCISETDANPLFSSTMPHAGLQQDIPLTQALCPSKDLAQEIDNAVEYICAPIFAEAQKHCRRNNTAGPGQVEVFRYRGIPTCGLIFVDGELGRIVPYIPFSGSNQSPAFVFSGATGTGEGRLYEYLWSKYLDVLECVGQPSIVLNRQAEDAADAGPARERRVRLDRRSGSDRRCNLEPWDGEDQRSVQRRSLIDRRLSQRGS